MNDQPDITWKSVSQKQMDALKHACRCFGIKFDPNENHHLNVVMESSFRAMAVDAGIKRKSRISQYELAEIMMLSKSTYWYSLIKNFKRGETVDSQFVYEGCQFLLKLVDWDYQNGKWWDFESVFPDQTERAFAMSHMLDTLYAFSVKSYSSAAFRYLPFLMFPKFDYRKWVNAILKKDLFGATALVVMYCNPEKRAKLKKVMVARGETRKCINPYCTTNNGLPSTVNLEKNKSGACCKACMSYECNHPTCVEKAKRMGWEKYTHPWGTKIAESHREYKKQAAII